MMWLLENLKLPMWVALLTVRQKCDKNMKKKRTDAISTI